MPDSIIKEEVYKEYKKLEDDCNRKMRQLVNCTHFVRRLQEMLDVHIQVVEMKRKTIRGLLDTMKVPNKDDFACLAKKAITNENKVDHLDDLLYELLQNQHTNKLAIISLKAALQNLSKSLEEESFQTHRIDYLRSELKEIKKLFRED
ncbi:hypothetical protein [Bacillus dakarensis]|uniref:hypothetical protein n=1 Tax=Robertmurraya dakarensis TaxID=1926278 RepID=UPI0009823BE5|nr:hypothetical protein [Bacillus dakarensis]